MITTKFTEMFGIEKPIVQGGMQNIAWPKFAALISNAGGMGTINVTCWDSAAAFEEGVKEM